MSVKASVEMMPELDELGAIQEAIGTISEKADWSPDLTFQIELILEELCINVINHGEVEGSQPIKVEIESASDLIKIEISDKGKAFDPTQDVATPKQITSIEESSIGGWGVHLAQVFSDEMHYERVGDTNYLTLVKRRNS